MKNLFILVSLVNLLNQPFNNDLVKKHTELLDQVFSSLEKYVANPDWLKDAKYVAFKNKMYDRKTLGLNEDDFYHAFDKGRKQLNFSHFQLLPKQPATKKNPTKSTDFHQPVVWKAIGKKTAYLKVSSFIIPGAPMVRALQEIGTDTYKNLIIDLRSNTGGSLDAAVILGQFLTQKNIDAGYYLTRSWFENHKALPTKTEVLQMPLLRDFTYTGIRKLFLSKEAFRTVIPGHKRPIFKGKVFVLIDQQTASTCEPLIDLLQKEKIATLVGEKSNGSMLSGHTYPINNEYEVFLPIADYYTAQGIKIDRVGVTPDVQIHPNKALDYVLESLK